MLAILMAIVTVASGAVAAEINCTDIFQLSKVRVACSVGNTTEINQDNVIFSGNKKFVVNLLWFERNDKIIFLPVKVYEKFPNLKTYSAFNVGIREISALNFEKLWDLGILNLSGNQIEFIPDDCFKKLHKLFETNLSINASFHLIK